MSTLAPGNTTVETAAAPAGHFFTDSHGTEPIRADLFGLDRLAAHARLLATHLRVARVVPGRPLLQHFLANRRCLIRAYREINAAYRLPGELRPRRRVADRQLPHHRGDAVRDPHRPAARLLPAAAQDSGRPARRPAARLRPGPGPDRPLRQLSGRGPHRPLRRGLPDDHPFNHRRTLGHPHHAAAGAGGQPAPTGRPDPPRPRPPERSQHVGRPRPRRGRAAPARPPRLVRLVPGPADGLDARAGRWRARRRVAGKSPERRRPHGRRRAARAAAACAARPPLRCPSATA